MAKVSRKARDAARRNTRMRFEQWAKNPTCEANTISAVRNVRMADVARAEGISTTFGQSPFAIIRGDQFERSLFYNDAKRLIAELIAKEVLPKRASGFIDFRIKMNGGTRLISLDKAIDETTEFIRQLATRSSSGRKRLASVAAGATVRIPKGVLLPEAILIIDALAVRTDCDPPTVFVGEIKTYPDRGGHTDGGELAVARAQAGIYAHGLDLVIDSLGVKEKVHVSREGFLVLTRPGSNFPSVRAHEDLRYQAERAKRGFELLERAAGALSKDLWANEDSEPPTELIDAVGRAETNYSESCLSFCDLAARCFAKAEIDGDPIILGENVRRFLGEISLTRAVQLLDGAKPKGDAETDFCRRVQQSDGMLGK